MTEPSKVCEKSPAEINKTNEEEESCEMPVEQDYLERILNDYCKVEGKLVGTKCSVVGKGKGFGSVITKVVMEWTGADAKALEALPKSVVIKQPTLAKMKEMQPENVEKGHFEVDVLQMIHNNEVRAYQFLTKHQPCPIPMARLYHCELMDGPGSGIIVMEDLTDTATSLWFTDEANKEQVMAVAECFGAVQAYAFNHPDWRDYIKIVESKTMDRFHQFDAMMKATYEQFPQFATPQEELRRMYEKALDTYRPYKDPKDRGFTPVFSLGDCQPNNILWYKDADGKPSNRIAAFIDFQIAHVGYCCGDWMSFSALTLKPPMRREYEDEAIKRYFEKLREKIEGHSAKFDEKEFRRGYRNYMLIYSVMTYPMFAAALAYVGIDPSFKEVLFQRFTAYVEDCKICDY